MMSLFDATLVNRTIIEAVRVALERYKAEGSQLITPNSDADISTEQKSIIRQAILSGLEEFCAAAQKTVSVEAGKQSKKFQHGGDLHPANRMALNRAMTLGAAYTKLIQNATATREVVQQMFSIISTHFKKSKDSRESEHADSLPSIVLYAATPELTEVVEAAAAAQSLLEDHPRPNAGALPTAAETIATHLGSFSAAQWVWMTATVLLGYLVLRFTFDRLLGLGGVLSSRRPRTTTVLIGLPNSGKTTLFAQLAHHQQLLETRTSMCPNIGYLFAAAQHNRAPSGAGVKLVDCPGHPRLNEEMLHAINEAVNVVVVIDSVTVQDPQQEGVAALAELLTNVLQSPEFYGVRRLLFACTKRDEVISYSSKAVRRLLEAAMAVSIESRQNLVGHLESVRDAKNRVILSTGKKGSGSRGGSRRYHLSVDCLDSDTAIDHAASGRNHFPGATGSRMKSFSFEQLGIPLVFLDVSSRPNAEVHSYSITPIENFLQKHM